MKYKSNNRFWNTFSGFSGSSHRHRSKLNFLDRSWRSESLSPRRDHNMAPPASVPVSLTESCLMGDNLFSPTSSIRLTNPKCPERMPLAVGIDRPPGYRQDFLLVFESHTVGRWVSGIFLRIAPSLTGFVKFIDKIA